MPNIVGGSQIDAVTAFGDTQFARTKQINNGAYGSGYLGIELDSGFSFELGAVQIANKRSKYTSEDLPGVGFSSRINMTVPYVGVGYRIPMYVPEFLESEYTSFLHNISFKPFAGVGVGISNTMFTATSDARDIGIEDGRQTDATVMPYFKIDAQYKFSEHWYVGGNVGFLLNTRYTKMREAPAEGPIKVPGLNASNTLLTGVSIQYMF